MIATLDPLIQEMTDVVVREVDPEAIILFGSRASGTVAPGSDVDLMIIEKEPFSPGRERITEMTRIWQALAHFPVAKDILVYSREEFDQWRNSRNHVIGRAAREGSLVYGSL